MDMHVLLHTPTPLPWLKVTLASTEEKAVWVSEMI